ncbi:MAG: dihydroorotate dehydrogenase electron transfer subunit [Clostridia bacterium]|nr:dihydroorotate dehydrogenase electron transfer subunit [Clostridia bacterium]
MKQVLLRIEENLPLAKDVYRMRLAGDVSGVERPGQFVNLKLEGRFLRRPISVFDRGEHAVTLIYKAVGEGTRQMSRMEAGEVLDVLTGLGNGYDLTRAGDSPLLLGGGVGVPPLYWLARELRAQGKRVTAVLGFNTGAEVFGEAEFRSLGCDTVVTTVDGSCGRKGFVTDALPEAYSYFYACGPMPMLRAVNRAAVTEGEFSLEERMGCGFGACMGCSIRTAEGFKRVCREGPVFRKSEILWD